MPVRALRSSRKTIGQSSFSVADPHMWNDLPINVHSAQFLTTFGKHLKTSEHLFISPSLSGLNVVTCSAAFIKKI